jgi:hypothetical protein
VLNKYIAFKMTTKYKKNKGKGSTVQLLFFYIMAQKGILSGRLCSGNLKE